MANERLRLTREQLSAFLKDHQSIKQFEQLFSTVDAIAPDFVTEVQISAENANSRAQQALDILQSLEDALGILELLPTEEEITGDDNTYPDVNESTDEIQIPFVEDTTDDIQIPDEEPILDIAYGELYATNTSQVVTVAAINTAYEVGGGMTAGLFNRVNNGGSHYLEIIESGVYKITWSMSIDTAAAADEIEGGFMINGTAQSNATSHTTVSAAADASSISASGFFTAAQADQVSLFVRNHTAARDITVEHVALTIWRIGR